MSKANMRNRAGSALAALLALAVLVLPAAASASATASGPRSLSAGNAVQSITCPTPSQCTATTAKQVLTFNPLQPGRLWARNPFKPRAMPITSIWCPSKSLCATISGQAVTTIDPQRFRFHPSNVIEPVSGEGLASVRCPSRSECVFVDSFGDGITYDPQRGKLIKKRLNVEGNEALTALACPSATECVATDDDGTEITFEPVTGRRLKAAKIDPAVGLDAPSGGSDTELDSVSCSSTRLCAAVDSQGDVVVFDPLGASTRASTPVVTTFTTPWKSISCRPTGLCVAVGPAGQALIGSTLAPQSWGTQTILGAADLNAVACPTVTECVTVDSAGNAFLIDPSSAA